MSKITIARSSEYMNKMRDIAIYINGEKAGVIANGQIKEFEVPNGQNTVMAKIDWCSSREVPLFLSDKENVTLKLYSFGKAFYFIPISFAIVIAHFILHYFYHIGILFPALALVLVVFTYYLTFGRKDYLKLMQGDLL